MERKRFCPSLRELDEAGKDVRVWCFDCARGERVDTIMWQRFEARCWAMTLDAAARRFRCRECGSSRHVALFPATRPYHPPTTRADVAAAIYFGARKAAKAQRRDSLGERAAQLLAEAYARIAARRTEPVPRPPAELRLVWSRPEQD